MKGTVKALVIPVGSNGMVQEIVPDLDTLQGIVGGYIEAVSYDGTWHAYCDEEGKIKRKPVNPFATALAYGLGWPKGDMLVGDVVFLGESESEDGEEGDVPQDVIDKWKALHHRES